MFSNTFPGTTVSADPNADNVSRAVAAVASGVNVARKAVFLDRDGTVIVERNYLQDVDLVTFEKSAVEGIHCLVTMGYVPILITNQSGVGRGMFGMEAVQRVNAKLTTMLAENGISLAGIYICPHAPQDGCNCRKPRPGLLRRASEELLIDLTQSVVVGDKVSDLLAAISVGAKGFLVTTGKGRDHIHKALDLHCIVCRNILEVASSLNPAATK